MRVLITGGAGFIGSHLLDALTERGHEILVLDNLDPQVHGPNGRPRLIEGHLQSGRARFVQGDVADLDAVTAALSGIEVVVHLAAVVGVGQSMYQPHYYVHANSEGTGILLEAVARSSSRPRRLVVASSMSLYGEGAYACRACEGTLPRERTDEQLTSSEWEVLCQRCGKPMTPVPTPESKLPEVASVYAATKKHQEELFVAFGRGYKMTTFALRFFNVFGPRQSLSNPYTGVAAIFLSRLLNGRPPLIFEDGLQSRDFIDVRDVAQCLRLAVEHEDGGAHVLNVGTGRATSVLAMAETLASLLGRDLPPQLLGKYRVGDVRHCFADPTLARKVLGFEAQRTLAEGLPLLIEWCRGEESRDAVDASMKELQERGLMR